MPFAVVVALACAAFGAATGAFELTRIDVSPARNEKQRRAFGWPKGLRRRRTMKSRTSRRGGGPIRRLRATKSRRKQDAELNRLFVSYVEIQLSPGLTRVAPGGFRSLRDL